MILKYAIFLPSVKRDFFKICQYPNILLYPMRTIEEGVSIHILKKSLLTEGKMGAHRKIKAHRTLFRVTIRGRSP